MTTQSELMVQKELTAVEKYATAKGFQVAVVDTLTFVVKNLPSKNGEKYALHVHCEDYPNKPPIFRWCAPETFELESPKDTPKGGGGFFHGCGTPCAPWNRNSYKQFHSKAPHGDWNMEGWQTNSKIGQCTTIPRMIVKMCTELQSERYIGRAA